VKRGALLKHLSANGCVFVREGARHSFWLNPKQDRRSAVPRHGEVSDILARKLWKDLGVPFVHERVGAAPFFTYALARGVISYRRRALSRRACPASLGVP
jgi:mRNA interferase HicA